MAALARASAGTHGGHIAPGHHRSPRSDDVRHRLACHCDDEVGGGVCASKDPHYMTQWSNGGHP